MDFGEIRNKRVRPDKPNVKQRPDSADKLGQDIAKARSVIERSLRIVKLKGHDGWEALLENARERLEAIDDTLDGYHTYTDKGRDHLLAQKAETRQLLKTIETHEGYIEIAMEEIDRKTAELKEREQRLRTAQA